MALSAPLSGRAEITLGTYAHSPIQALVAAGQLELPLARESYALSRLPDGRWVLAGFDETGLMYGCQALKEQLTENGGRWEALRPVREQPATKVRGLYDFLHNRDLEAEWFYSEEYWTRYFDRMAESRYNSFNLVFSHQTYYLAPMFAYFLDMPEFPDIHPADASAQDIARNHRMLQFISRRAQERGVDFILGIWQMCAWKGGENDWRPYQPGLVEGLTSERLEAYTYLGMKKMIEQFPAIRGLQIRANEESGIPREQQAGFYKNTLFRAMSEAQRPFVFDFRCWLAEPETVEHALNMVPGTRLSCKYWGEFMGAPYQPAKINPGYSYSDFLRQPMERDFIYQVWSLGSPRLLLWGDPQYVRRFVGSLKLGGGCGFEINLPLAQKGYGNEPGAWRIFQNPEEEYTQFEIERYWLFHRLFGRLSYNPECSESAWMQEMRTRFGAQAEKVMALYQAGSDILTFLAQYQLSDLNMYIWPEIDTGGQLDFYLQTPPSDRCVLSSVPEYVDALLSGVPLGKFSPLDSSQRFKEMAQATQRALSALAPDPENRELTATLRDFEILSELAMYHSHKIVAAVALETYYRTRDQAQLERCDEYLTRAGVHWERLIALTQNHYHQHMVTGPNDAGCWKTKLTLIYEEQLRIKQLLRQARRFGNYLLGLDFGPMPAARGVGFYRPPVTADYWVERGFEPVDGQLGFEEARGYGWLEGGGQALDMPPVRLDDTHLDPYRRDCWTKNRAEEMKGWRDSLTEDGVCGRDRSAFGIRVPAGDYQVRVLVADHTPQARLRGPMNIAVNSQRREDIMAYPGEEQLLEFAAGAADGLIRVELSGDWLVSGLMVYPMTPEIRAARPQRALAGGNGVTATVTAPEGVSRVTLKLDGRELAMERQQGDVYRAQLPVEPGAERVRYAIKAWDGAGRMAQSAPVTLPVAGQDSAFEFRHQPVERAQAGQMVELALQVASALPLQRVTLHYSAVNQFLPMEQVEMYPSDGAYRARIPGAYVDAQWQLMYYFEAVDACGGGAMFPDFRKRTPYYVIEVEDT